MNLLGKGSFACVYRARSCHTGIEVAIKMIDKQAMRRAGMVDRVRAEVEIHSQLKHPAILEMYGCFEDDNYVYLVLEMCHNGEMSRYLKNQGRPFTEEQARQFLREISSGLLYLHAHGVIHRDLTLANLLLASDMSTRIADFGLAARLPLPGESRLTVCGTPNYMSPEVASRGPHGAPADAWALGCAAYAMLVGRLPFQASAVPATLARVMLARFELPPTLSPAARDLLRRLLRRDPGKRPGLPAVLEHPFLADGGGEATAGPMAGPPLRPGDEGSLDSGNATMTAPVDEGDDEREARAPAEGDGGREGGGGGGGASEDVRVDGHQAVAQLPAAADFLRPQENGAGIANGGRTAMGLEAVGARQHDRAPSADTLCPAHQGILISGPAAQLCGGPQCPLARWQPAEAMGGRGDSCCHTPPHACQASRCCHATQNSSLLPLPSSVLSPLVTPHLAWGSPCHGAVATAGCACTHVLAAAAAAATTAASCCCRSLLPSGTAWPCDCSSSSSRLQRSEVNKGNAGGGRPVAARQLYRGSPFRGKENRADAPVHGSHAEEVRAPEVPQQQQRPAPGWAAGMKSDPPTCAHGAAATGEASAVAPQLVVTPLNTRRLQPYRLATSRAEVSITCAGEVCMQFLKRKEQNVCVYEIHWISPDGRQVWICQPPDGTSPAEEPLCSRDSAVSYSLDKLPGRYWRKYCYASRFVALVRSKTPKVTLSSDDARFSLMDNGPPGDLEARFHDGVKVLIMNGFVSVTDASGLTHTFQSPCDASQPDGGGGGGGATGAYVRRSLQAWQQCLQLEEIISLQEQSSGSGASFFPASVSRPSVVNTELQSRPALDGNALELGLAQANI
ncbi:unnamed protein product [Lampetra planeri]